MNTNTLDLARARMLWPGLEPVLSEAILRVNQSTSSGNCPASFGLRNQRQSGSPVKPAASITEAMDVVIRDTIYEDESHGEVI
ncbi:MAG: hypothetical protein GIS02_02350 [Methanosarcinales archaeon]|uniref:Uncharacterized protein n=1 Tax=Candidatus Ethanoperedens thermophilum TaxID=2766897 RepID=A0A848D6M5_9EURY|nr:hypothetical protein [Candidatus Ethanoperedens thermophilum]